jgi:hypothetical protein
VLPSFPVLLKQWGPEVGENLLMLADEVIE